MEYPRHPSSIADRDLKTAPPFAPQPTPRKRHRRLSPGPTAMRYRRLTTQLIADATPPHDPNRAAVPRRQLLNFAQTGTPFSKHASPRLIPTRPILPNQRNPHQTWQLATLSLPPELAPPCESSTDPKLPSTCRILRNQPVILQNQDKPTRHRAGYGIILRNQRRILTNKHNPKSTHQDTNTSEPTQARLHQLHSTRPDTAKPPPLQHLQLR